MSVQLHQLLPVHRAREQRRLRQLQADQAAQQRAEDEEQRAKQHLNNLQTECQATRAHALQGHQLSADEALAHLHYAAVLAQQASQAQTVWQTHQTNTEQANQLTQAAQAAYARQLQIRHLMQQASERQQQLLRRQLVRRDEQRSDDEFVPVWHAQQQRSFGAGGD